MISGKSVNTPHVGLWMFDEFLNSFKDSIDADVLILLMLLNGDSDMQRDVSVSLCSATST